MRSNPRPEGRIGRGMPWLRRRFIWKIGFAAVVAIGLYVFFRGGEEVYSTGTTFTARRGNLTISVLEGGSIEALESQTIKSEVKGQTKILTIVEEGYLVTEQDVAEGKVLVTLDNSQLLERKTQQEIQYQSALAAYTDAREQYEIQVKQNESDVRAAQLEAKFARMDFEKYLGAEAAREMLTELGLDVIPELTLPLEVAALEPPPEESGPDNPGAEPDPEPGGSNPIAIESVAMVSSSPIDFTEYAKPERLGDGEAQERLRKLRGDRFLAEEELALAETNFVGTQRLYEKNFVTQQEVERERMTVERNKNSAQASRIAEELFIKYEFPKQAEKLLSDYQEALRKLERTRKQATSKLAQAQAKLRSTEATYQLQENQLKELLELIEKCTIRAERTGLVVYGGSGEPWRYPERIQEGATVHERQEIITIPDMTKMGVNVKVHESAVKKVQKGQRATIKLDAYPDQQLTGEVIKVSPLPDSTRRWMNPDLKVYATMISVEGTHDWLKPGMSAQVEIRVQECQGVLYVPMQAVSGSNGERVVHVVVGSGTPQRRVVQTGQSNDEFIEIISGLEEGDVVLLRAPKQLEESKPEQEPEPIPAVPEETA